MMQGLNISIKPTILQLTEIEAWLQEEYKKKKEGFFPNMNAIKSAFEKEQLAIIKYQNNTIGFLAWHTYSDVIATIDITEIKAEFRKKGFGKSLFLFLVEHFKSINISVIKLECAPSNSEKVWKKLGFVEFPKNCSKWENENKELYKIIVPHLEPQKSNSHIEFIELWDEEKYKALNGKAKWKWNIQFKPNSNNLTLPIIHPCDQEWRIQWIKNETTIQNDNVKYFNNQDIRFGDFMIIKELIQKG